MTEGRPGEPGGKSVEVERPDPEGGSHTVTVREILRPVPATAVQRTITKLGMNARGFVECERRHNEATAQVLEGAESFLYVLGGVERQTRIVKATDSPREFVRSAEVDRQRLTFASEQPTSPRASSSKRFFERLLNFLICRR